MFCLGRPQGEDVYCINNQDTLLFSLLPVPCIELAEGDSCAALGSYSPGHVTVAPESLSLCRQRLASSSWSATLAMATGKVKSDRYGSRRLRAAGQWRFRGNGRDSSAVSSLGQATSQRLC